MKIIVRASPIVDHEQLDEELWVHYTFSCQFSLIDQYPRFLWI